MLSIKWNQYLLFAVLLGLISFKVSFAEVTPTTQVPPPPFATAEEKIPPPPFATTQEKIPPPPFATTEEKIPPPPSQVTTAQVTTTQVIPAKVTSTTTTEVKVTKPLYNWTGYYVGLDLGYAFAVNGSATVEPRNVAMCTPGEGCTANPTFANASVAGARVQVNPNNRGINGAGHVGYKQYLGCDVVGGFEADIRGFTDKTATGSIRVPGLEMGLPGYTLTSNTSVSSSIDMLSTLRGRLGYLITPTMLLSVTGGLAVAEVRSAVSITQFVTGPGDPGFATSWSSYGKYAGTRFGWTLGGGIEWMYNSRWSLRADYFYYDLGSASFNSNNLVVTTSTPGLPANYFVNSVNTTTYFRNQLLQIGFNYHFC